MKNKIAICEKKIYLCFILILSRIVTCPFLIEIKLLDFYAVVEVLFCEDITTSLRTPH